MIRTKGYHNVSRVIKNMNRYALVNLVISQGPIVLFSLKEQVRIVVYLSIMNNYALGKET